MKRNALLAGLLGLGLLTSGAAVASPRAPLTLTITKATVTAKWRESFLVKGKRKVTFTFTTTEVGNLEASVRAVKTGKLITDGKRFSVGPGTFTRSIEIGARPIPGPYRLRLKTMPTGPGAVKDVTIKAPPEGVVDNVYFSRTRNGPPVKVFRGGTSTIVVHFHFVARPEAGVVNFIWKKPGRHCVACPKKRFTGAATKPYKPNVSSFVCAKYIGKACGGGSLRKGKWYAILKAAGRVTKRQLVTVA